MSGEATNPPKRIFSPEHRANISKAMSGKKRGPMSAEAAERFRLSRIGKIQPPHARIRLSKIRRGEVPPHYDEMLAASNNKEHDRIEFVRVLWQRYRLTIEDFGWMWHAQEQRCALCGYSLVGKKGGYAVDHCHKTGRVRGILCRRCNHHVLPVLEIVPMERIRWYLGLEVSVA